jgi:hypothetical protein
MNLPEYLDNDRSTARLTARLTALAERSEAEFMLQYEEQAPASAKAELGISTRRLEGGVVLSMRNDPSGGYWCKALGFGHETAVTEELVARIIDIYRAEGVSLAALQIAPSALPADWPAIAAAHGLTPGGEIVKLACAVEDLRLDAVQTSLRVGPVESRDAVEWARVVAGTFGMPTEGGMLDMFAATVEHPGFHTFAAWDGEQIVAGGNLFVHDEVGSINSGATLPSHRNRGAQSAVIAARAAAAVAVGCRWVVAEAGKPPAGVSNPSLNNLTRIGLRPLYSRQNWTWRND